MSTIVLALSACGGGEKAQEPAKDQAPANEQQAPAQGDAAAANGEQLFKNTCSGCHGVDLSGGAGPSLKGIGSKLSKDDILGIINNGKGGMPAGLASGADAEAIATWLSEQK